MIDDYKICDLCPHQVNADLQVLWIDDMFLPTDTQVNVWSTLDSTKREEYPIMPMHVVKEMLTSTDTARFPKTLRGLRDLGETLRARICVTNFDFATTEQFLPLHNSPRTLILLDVHNLFASGGNADLYGFTFAREHKLLPGLRQGRVRFLTRPGAKEIAVPSDDTVSYFQRAGEELGLADAVPREWFCRSVDSAEVCGDVRTWILRNRSHPDPAIATTFSSLACVPTEHDRLKTADTLGDISARLSTGVDETSAKALFLVDTESSSSRPVKVAVIQQVCALLGLGLSFKQEVEPDDAVYLPYKPGLAFLVSLEQFLWVAENDGEGSKRPTVELNWTDAGHTRTCTLAVHFANERNWNLPTCFETLKHLLTSGSAAYTGPQRQDQAHPVTRALIDVMFARTGALSEEYQTPLIKSYIQGARVRNVKYSFQDAHVVRLEWTAAVADRGGWQ